MKTTSRRHDVRRVMLALTCAMLATGALQCRRSTASPPVPAAAAGDPSSTGVRPASSPGASGGAAAAPLDHATPPTAASRLLPGSYPVLAMDMTEVDLADVVSPPAVLLYFSTSCPHCWNVAGEFQQMCDRLVGHGVQCVGVVSSTSRLSSVRDLADQTGLRCTLVLDYAGRFRDGLRMTATPTALLLDGDGQIAASFDPFYRSASLAMEMAAAELQGRDPQTAWRAGEYLGARTCSPCHDVAYNSWLLSPHSVAVMRLPGETYLQPQCMACHATATGDPGGFVNLMESSHLRDVGCEACHGPSGGHGPDGLRPDRVEARTTCGRCHDEDHGLSLDLEAMVSAVDHRLAETLPRDQWNTRRFEIEQGQFPRQGLAVPGGTCVGSSACGPCHPDELAAWSAGPHGQAFETLKEQRSHKDQACLACHVPAGACDDPDLIAGEPGVHCEACHGPGGDHVSSGDGTGPLRGLRVSHQDECVVEPTCRACHTELRDPQWQLDVRLAGIHTGATD